MSKGSPIVPIRIPELTLAAIDAAIKSANKSRREAPYNRTSWILTACSEKLAHKLRSAKSGEKKRKRPLQEGV